MNPCIRSGIPQLPKRNKLQPSYGISKEIGSKIAFRQLGENKELMKKQ